MKRIITPHVYFDKAFQPETFLLILLLICIPSDIRAGESPLLPGLNDIDINIKETKRTRPSLIIDEVKDCLVDNAISTWDNLKPDFIEQCLLNTRLFSRVQVRIKKPIVEVVVEERWTLLPIPYMYSSGDDYTAGIFVMEKNLFGLGKNAGLGGSISANGNSFFLYYLDPAIMLTDWSASLRLGRMLKEPKLEYDDYEYYSYEVNNLFYGFNIGHKFILPELTFSIGLQRNEKEYEQVDSFLAPDDYDEVSVRTRIYYKNWDYKFYFNEGIKISLELDQQFYRSDENDKTLSWEMELDWQQQLIRHNALQLNIKIQEINNAALGDAILVGRDKGFRGVESQGLWVYSAQSLSLDYQIPVLKHNYGTWTLYPFIDLAHFDPAVDLPIDSFISCGVGGSLYLKNIAFPGVGLLMGYNNEFDDFFVSFSLGMRF